MAKAASSGAGMSPSLRADLISRLTGTGYEGKLKGEYINRIECPSCHHKEAWAYASEPWVVFCGRSNSCGDKNHVKDLFPDFFEDWSERYKPKANERPDPLAVARAYLREGRGFNTDRLKGLYTQEWYQDQTRNIGSATVRFDLGGNAYWERLIDRPHRFGKQKARFGGEFKGKAWTMANLADAIDVQEVWITEGIFDTIALHHNGLVSAAAMSCVNYPSLYLERLSEAAARAGKGRPVLVWALDANRAGRDWTLKHAARARKEGWECEAAQPPDGRDWNDLHQRKELGDDDIERYRYGGDLLLAESAQRKAELMYHRRERRTFWFEFRGQTWWFSLNLEDYHKALKAATGEDPAAIDDDNLDEAIKAAALQRAATVTRICTAYPTALYYQQDTVTDESWYYWRIESPEGAVVKNTFSGAQLSSASEFKKRLLAIAAGAVWTGSSGQLDTLLQDQLPRIKTVATIDYIGYSREHSVYVLGDIAIAKGRVHRITSEDYFSIGRLRIKTLSRSVPLSINPEISQMRRGWVDDLVTAFGNNGVAALAFWFGSLFAEQIRHVDKSFPFMEIVGEPSSGKTTLIEFMWKLLGRTDYEGFDPAKASMAARARNFAQVANLPVVLIESDRERDDGVKGRQFDWDELKTAYNGRSIRARGVRNGGNETYEPPFRGSIVISQNAAVQASDAIQSRLLHLTFSRATHTPQGKKAAEALEGMPVESVSGFIVRAASAESTVLDLLKSRRSGYEATLLQDPDIGSVRIAKNHSQLMVLVDALGSAGIGLIDDETVANARAHVLSMARERQVAMAADHPNVEAFWDAFDYLQGIHKDRTLNHYGDGSNNRIAVNLPEFESRAAAYRLQLPPTIELKRYLRSSRSRRFLAANKPIHSVLKDRTVRCWVFQTH